MSIRHRPPASATAHHRPATRPSTRNVGSVSPFRPMTIERARASSTLVRSVWESDAIPIVRPSRRGRRWPHRRSGRGLVAPPPGPSTRHAGADPPGPVCNLGPIRSRDRRSGRQGSHRAQRRQGVPKRGRVKYSPPQRLASTVGATGGLERDPGGSTLSQRAVRATGQPLRTRATRAPSPGAGSTGASNDDIAALPDLGSQEELLVVLRGIGAAMFLSSHRVILARDGFARRPRSGIQSFWLDEIRNLRLELGSGLSGRIVVRTASGPEAVSMFFEARSLDRAHTFLDVARPLVARQRRRGPGDRPVRPPSGPAGSGSTEPA